MCSIVYSLIFHLSFEGFLNKLAEAAEQLNHHPDMTLCEYNRVIITTTTHDAGGITDNDIRLTQGFEEILEGIYSLHNVLSFPKK